MPRAPLSCSRCELYAPQNCLGHTKRATRCPYFAFEDDNEEIAAVAAAADKDRARTVPAPAIGVDGDKVGGAAESGRAAQFADLLGRCVRASLLGSDELTSIV